MVSCTANFQETSATVGDTIHADFTWTDALWHIFDNIFASMHIIDPDGTPRASHFEYNDDTGSYSLNFTTDMAGTPQNPWTAVINVANITQYVECTDTVVVLSPGNAQGQITNYYAIPNPLPPGGGNSTAYVTGKNIGDTAGYFILHIWTAQHGDHYSDSQLLGPGDSMSYNTLLANIIQNTNVQFLIWYWNGTEWELHDEVWPYVIEILPSDDCIGGIYPASPFHTGPFPPGTNQLLAELSMQNTGTQNGCLIRAKFVEYPGGGPGVEVQLGDVWNRTLDSGESTKIDFYWNTPVGVTSWPLGVKVWAPNFENEPPWGALGTKIFKIR